MLFIKRSRFVVSGIVWLSGAALVAAQAGDVPRSLRPSSTSVNVNYVNASCGGSGPCLVANNSGAGPGTTSTSSGGDGLNASGVNGVVAAGSAANGDGVIGLGDAAGVAGTSKSSNGNGVEGSATGGTGVYGSATSGIGVYGTGLRGGVFGNSTDAQGIGVDGTNSSNDGKAIVGVATGSGSSAIGVLGLLNSDKPTGIALYGLVGTSSNNAAAAVEGVDAAPSGGVGALGMGTGEGAIVLGAAAKGNATHPALAVLSGAGADSLGVFNSTGSAPLETFRVEAATSDAALCSAKHDAAPCSAGGDVYITGDLHVKGAVYTTKGGAKPYGIPQGRSARLEDDGEAQLSSGGTYVRLDPDFAASIDFKTPYIVFVTPEGDCAMYVSGRSPHGFFVHEIGGGRSGARFAYRVVGDALAPAAAENAAPAIIHGDALELKAATSSAVATAQRAAAASAELARRATEHRY